MKELKARRFITKILNKKQHYPLQGHLDLTYFCNFNCIHCYCKGKELRDKELTTSQWKRILDEIKDAGCLFLTISGGEPLLRKDFLEIYAYAKRRGFLITLFSNGMGIHQKIINYLVKSPPLAIEITLNGISKMTFESVTQTKDTFEKVTKNIKTLAKRGIKLIIKANCLKQNKEEVVKVKKWAEDLLGKPAKNRYRFKYDPMIFPRLNGEKNGLAYRLSSNELLNLKRQDVDIWQEHQRFIAADSPDLTRQKDFLYQCNAWQENFFIDPYGRLKFCELSDKFSVDLKTTSFAEGFYKTFPRLLQEKFKTNSACRSCSLRPLCYYCPARAYLETGNEEGPVEYYCALAKATSEQMKEAGRR